MFESKVPSTYCSGAQTLSLEQVASDPQSGTSAHLRREEGRATLILRGAPGVVEVPVTAEILRSINDALGTSPSKSASEIEAKWLVESRELFEKSIDFLEAKRVEITQGYVVIDPSGTEIRVRRKECQGEVSHVLTVKSKGGVIRGEVEFAIAGEIFDALFAGFVGGRDVIKTRWAIPYVTPQGQSITLEYDRYYKTGPDVASKEYLPFSTVEVEFSSLDERERFQAAHHPPGVGREVSDITECKNQSLAVRGIGGKGSLLS